MIEIQKIHPLRRRWVTRSGVRRSLWGKTREDFDRYDPAIEALLDGWLEAFRSGRLLNSTSDDALGKGFALIGEPGRGKTLLASSLLQEVALTMPTRSFRPTGNGYYPTMPLYLGYYPELLDLAKRTYSPDANAESRYLLDQIFGRGDDPVQVLVIDDLGKEHRTASHWAESFFDQLTRARFQQGLSTIVTTNVEIEDWEDVYGPAMASFAYEALTPIKIEGSRDRRKS